MTIEEAKELKVGDRVRFPESGDVVEVFWIYEKGVTVIGVNFRSSHSVLIDWGVFDEYKAEKL